MISILQRLSNKPSLYEQKKELFLLNLHLHSSLYLQNNADKFIYNFAIK